jgi:osmotically-inducible protein OsmY
MEGDVDWQFQKSTAENAISNISGVRGIRNLITITPKVNISGVENRIKNALQRSEAIEAGNIAVRAEGNKIILKGKVRSWAERREVERAVWSTPGVAEVEDDLLIGI